MVYHIMRGFESKLQNYAGSGQDQGVTLPKLKFKS